MNVHSGLNSQPITLHGLRLLIVDDSEDSVEMIGLLLRQQGAHVTTVTSGAAALEYATDGQFELVISDIGMPEIDGLEMIRRLRKQTRHATVPAVALTGFTTDEDIQEIYTARYTAHLPKPIDFDLMLKVVAKAVHPNQ